MGAGGVSTFGVRARPPPPPRPGHRPLPRAVAGRGGRFPRPSPPPARCPPIGRAPLIDGRSLTRRGGRFATAALDGGGGGTWRRRGPVVAAAAAAGRPCCSPCSACAATAASSPSPSRWTPTSNCKTSELSASWSPVSRRPRARSGPARRPAPPSPRGPGKGPVVPLPSPPGWGSPGLGTAVGVCVSPCPLFSPRGLRPAGITEVGGYLGEGLALPAPNFPVLWRNSSFFPLKSSSSSPERTLGLR